MHAEAIETDYLVIGAGAAAMAFVDTLLSETDASVVLVDRRHKPGGHWNNAYPFVGLHQPAAFYGVASRELSEWKKDEAGLNAGFYSLSTGAEVLAHFDQVMRQRFLPSGRVVFHPMTEYSGESRSHRLTSLASGETRYVRPRRLVDVTHARTEIPSTHPPKYDVAPGVTLIPVNGLPDISGPSSRYAVIGSGKTGIDACLWLLQNGVAPGRIRWIMPRDAWLLNRAHSQPGAENFETSMGAVISQFEAIAEASSLADLFHRLEAADLLSRIDPQVEPTRYRCAVVSQEELRTLRLIPDIVRFGRVRAVEPTTRSRSGGSPRRSGYALRRLFSLRYPNASRGPRLRGRGDPPSDGSDMPAAFFSAALIEWIEAHVADATEKNAVCDPVPSPAAPVDWLRMWAATLRNTSRWRRRPDLDAWLRDCRLNSMNAFLRGVRPDDKEEFALLKRAGEAGAAAAARIPDLLSA